MQRITSNGINAKNNLSIWGTRPGVGVAKPSLPLGHRLFGGQFKTKQILGASRWKKWREKPPPGGAHPLYWLPPHWWSNLQKNPSFDVNAVFANAIIKSLNLLDSKFKMIFCCCWTSWFSGNIPFHFLVKGWGQKLFGRIHWKLLAHLTDSHGCGRAGQGCPHLGPQSTSRFFQNLQILWYCMWGTNPAGTLE